MNCIKILKKMNENKLNGYKYLIVKELTELEKQEILDCGYFLKKIKDGYQISEDQTITT